MDQDKTILRVSQRADAMAVEFVGGSLFASAWSNGNVCLHDLKNGSAIKWQGIGLHSGAVNDIDVVSDGVTSLIASGGQDGNVNLLDPSRPDLCHTVVSKQSSIQTVKFVSSNTLAYCGMGGRLSLLDWRSPRTSKATWVDSNASMLRCLCVHPASPNIIATGSTEGVVSVWDIRNEQEPTFSIQGHIDDVCDISFLHAPRTSLVTCGEDGRVWHWDFNAHNMDESEVNFSLKQRGNLQETLLHQHVLPVNALDVCPTQEGATPGQLVLAATDAEDLLSFHCDR